MTTSIRIHILSCIAIGSVLVIPPACLAQQSDANGVLYQADGNQDGSACPPLSILWPLPGAAVVSCQHGASVEVTFPLKPDEHGYAQEKRVRGAFEFREYKVDQLVQDASFDNMLRELPMAGFNIKFSSKPSTITARKGDVWALVNISGEFYNVSLVKEPPEVWESAKTAEEIAREIQAHNRVDIYGIQFSSDDQSILETESPVLSEILKYLKQNPGVSVIIESHKWTTDVPPETDAETTRERANAVMDWLIAHGVTRSRVQPRPAGRNNPITGNESPSEIQRNERMVLKKPTT